MSQNNGIIKVDIHTAQAHNIVTQRFLELGGHKVVSRPTAVQDSEMNLEPEKVKEERHANETERTSRKVLRVLLERQAFFVVEEIPQINCNSGANGDEGEYADVLGGDDA